MNRSRAFQKYSILGTLAVAVLLLLSPPTAAQSRIIPLVVGEQKTIPIKGVSDIIVGNQRIADVKLMGRNTIIIWGKARGRTNLTIFRKSKAKIVYTIVVSKQDVSQLKIELKKLLDNIEGVKVRSVGDRVILDGTALTTNDFRRINEVVAMYPQVKSFVKVNASAKKLMADQLNLELKRSGLKDVEANVVGTKIFLEGSVESEADLNKAREITAALGEEVTNLLTVGIKRMILVEIDFIEIKKSGTDHIGIKWPLDVQGNANAVMTTNRVFEGPGIDVTRMTGTVTGGSSFGFGFMMQDGYARVLARPRLVCASGEQAEFMAGGEVPIVVVTAQAVHIEFKPFGIILNISPTADRHGNIQMAVYTEVSDIDRSIGFVSEGLDVPGFVKDSAKTNVTVRHGQTIILGNLFHRAEEKVVSKVPLLGHIPIIGELFKSRAFKDKKTELCVFVTPRIVDPDTPKIRKMIADIKRDYKEAESEVQFGIFD